MEIYTDFPDYKQFVQTYFVAENTDSQFKGLGFIAGEASRSAAAESADQEQASATIPSNASAMGTGGNVTSSTTSISVDGVGTQTLGSGVSGNIYTNT